MFIGKNLANLRIMYGYSRKKLSDMLGVTEQTVWQYENNYISPKMQIVNELKRIFYVKSKYFYTPDFLSQLTYGNVQMINIAYRSKMINSISKTQAEAKYIEYVDAFINYLTDKVNYPIMKIIQLRNEVIEYLNTSKENRELQINRIASMARKKLNFRNGTNDNLLFLVEKSGIFVFEKAIGEEIDAYSLWTGQERPYIILGNIKRSAVRRNFDIAHELGHLLLHYRYEFTGLDRKEYQNLEKEANLFAGAFLLPEDEFVNDMENMMYVTNPDSYIDLKKKWGASLQVLGYRAANLKIMDSKSHRNFYAALHRKGYLQQEPLDEILLIQKPMKVKTIIDFVFKNNLIDIYEMLENDWKVDISFFDHLTGIDSKFFDKYLEHSENFGLENIVDVSSRISVHG